MENNPTSPQAIILFIFSLLALKTKIVLTREFLFPNVLLTTEGEYQR